jgi:hypothetical protein
MLITKGLICKLALLLSPVGSPALLPSIQG